MRTLFISNVVPWPLDAGNKIRAYHLLRALSRASDVTLVCFAYPEDGFEIPEALRPLVHQSFVLSRETCRYRRDAQLPPPFGWARAMLAYCHPTRTVSLRAWESPEAAELIERLRGQRFDVAWGQWLGSLRYLARFEGTPRVLNLNDLEHKWLGHRLRNGGFSPSLMPFDWIEFLKLRRFERGLSRMTYELVVCSEVDRQALGGGPHVWVIPNGADPPVPQPAASQSTPEILLLFVGEMSYAPNADAVRFFAGKIFPLIRREIPQARFVIVGRNPGPAVRALDDGRVITVTGAVPSVDPYLARASVIVVPIRFGGGTRIKILEAMLHRKAVVSTTVGAEGIEAESEKHLLLADDPTAFANSCLRLLRDGALRQRLVAAAYRLVSDKYQWSQIEFQVQEMVQACVHQGRTAAEPPPPVAIGQL